MNVMGIFIFQRKQSVIYVCTESELSLGYKSDEEECNITREFSELLVPDRWNECLGSDWLTLIAFLC